LSADNGKRWLELWLAADVSVSALNFPLQLNANVPLEV